MNNMIDFTYKEAQLHGDILYVIQCSIFWCKTTNVLCTFFQYCFAFSHLTAVTEHFIYTVFVNKNTSTQRNNTPIQETTMCCSSCVYRLYVFSNKHTNQPLSSFLIAMDKRMPTKPYTAKHIIINVTKQKID